MISWASRCSVRLPNRPCGLTENGFWPAVRTRTQRLTSRIDKTRSDRTARTGRRRHVNGIVAQSVELALLQETHVEEINSLISGSSHRSIPCGLGGRRSALGSSCFAFIGSRHVITGRQSAAHATGQGLQQCCGWNLCRERWTARTVQAPTRAAGASGQQMLIRKRLNCERYR